MELNWNNIKCYYNGMNEKRPKPFTYYDTPDGENLFQKLLFTTKTFGSIGFFLGAAKTYIISLPSSRVVQLIEILRVTTPFVLCSATFTVGEYTSAKIRSKDDELNAQIGGVAAGIIYGAWARKPLAGLLSATALGVICGLKKLAAKNGIIYPNVSKAIMVDSPWTLKKLDFTLTEDVQGDWLAKK